MKNFRPHKVTPEEIEICKQLQETYCLYCRKHECEDCPLLGDPFEDSNIPCKILFAVQYMQKEINELKATNAALCNRVAELHDDLNTTAHNMTKEIEQCNK